jgi:hypothetical protein
MSEAAQFKTSAQLLSSPRPQLTEILSKQERFVKRVPAAV